MSKFKIGDVVRLNSDRDYKMTVNALGKDVDSDPDYGDKAVGTVAFSRDHTQCEAWVFHEDMLEK